MPEVVESNLICTIVSTIVSATFSPMLTKIQFKKKISISYHNKDMWCSGNILGLFHGGRGFKSFPLQVQDLPIFGQIRAAMW